MSADPTDVAFATDAPGIGAPAPSTSRGFRSGRFRRRGGRASKQKRIDEHRFELNVKTDDDRRAKIAEKFGVPHTSIELPPDLSRRVKARGQTILQPTMRLPVVTGCITSVLDECFSFLKAIKVDVAQEDVDAVMYVTSLQISAKIYMSSIRNHVALEHIDICWSTIYTSVASTCSDNFLPVARFIDAIGSFRHDGTTYAPAIAYSADNHVNRSVFDLNGPDYGRALTHMCCSQASYDIVLRLSLLDDNSYQEFWNHLINYQDNVPLKMLIPHRVDGVFVRPTYDHVALIERYKKFTNSLVKKFPRAVVNMDIQSGLGSHIQLVGSKKSEMDSIDAYSQIKMDSGDMTLGGLFGYGRDIVGVEPSLFHADDACPYKLKVYDTGWIQDMARAMHPPQ